MFTVLALAHCSDAKYRKTGTFHLLNLVNTISSFDIFVCLRGMERWVGLSGPGGCIM